MGTFVYICVFILGGSPGTMFLLLCLGIVFLVSIPGGFMMNYDWGALTQFKHGLWSSNIVQMKANRHNEGLQAMFPAHSTFHLPEMRNCGGLRDTPMLNPLAKHGNMGKHRQKAQNLSESETSPEKKCPQ